jgi:hypothetical protein
MGVRMQGRCQGLEEKVFRKGDRLKESSVSVLARK